MRTVVVTPSLPAEAKLPCPDPVTLPDHRLSETETANLWGKDRSALRICETRRKAATGVSHVQ